MSISTDNEGSVQETDLSDLGVAGVIMKWIVLLLMCWKSRYGVSDTAIESILKFFPLFSCTCLK